MPSEPYKHIFLRDLHQSQRYTRPPGGRGPTPNLPPRDRIPHSTYLNNRFNAAWQGAEQRQAVSHVDRHGVYLDFVSAPDSDLALKSLEAQHLGIRLLNVRRKAVDEKMQTLATVYVPLAKRQYFLKKIKAYAEENTSSSSDKPKNAPLVNSISDINLSILESFWQDDPSQLPGDMPSWVEVWLCSSKSEVGINGVAENEVVTRFVTLMQEQQIEVGEGTIEFPERAVIMIHATRSQLEQLIVLSDDIAELRSGKKLASFFANALDNPVQLDHVRELLGRIEFENDTDVTICILDTGVNNRHDLLAPVLNDTDLHTAIQEWGTHDHEGHGTCMAGIAAYGDLLAALNSGDDIKITHTLESAKIVPPPPEETPMKLWGHMTAQGLFKAEIQAPYCKRIVCLATTATDTTDLGRPSSWSGQLDELASGVGDTNKRLIIVSAGNVRDSDSWRNYPVANLTKEVEDPGQAWNALTVGAYTTKVVVEDPTLQSYVPIAPHGGLSPYSTTSRSWSVKERPIKPEVLFEGGNVAKAPDGAVLNPEDLQLLSTSHDPTEEQFVPFNATSAAAAQASWMAAKIQSLYPDAWPETIRALLVHSAEWTDAMMAQFFIGSTRIRQYANLLRTCGYGVPNMERALYCAANSLTLISQAELQPYGKPNGRDISTQDMHFYSLPWPAEVLFGLGETNVEMRVTLSYFIEPGPGEIGWKDRYRYPSHTLRFAVNGPSETEEEFIKRINKRAREEGDTTETQGPADKWTFGPNTRDVGSIHSDIWQGTAADLGNSNLIAVFPTGGWWKERKHLRQWDRSCRYSLIVSIKTPSEDIDIYTPVAALIATPITIPTR